MSNYCMNFVPTKIVYSYSIRQKNNNFAKFGTNKVLYL